MESELLAFVLGAIVASFVGVLVGRLYTGEGIVRGRSRCDACGRELSLRALVPIVSFLLLRGRAECCGARLSPLGPLSETLLGGLFVLSYQKFGLSLGSLLLAVALTLMLALVLYDLAHQILPPVLLAAFLITSAFTRVAFMPEGQAFLESFVTAAAMALFFALIHFASRGRAMGLADAPFVFGCALLVGGAAFSGFLFSFWIGALVGVIVLAQRPVGSRMMVEVPFAPFMAAGFLLAFFTQWNPLDVIARILS